MGILGDATLIDNTICGNTAEQGGGGVCVYSRFVPGSGGSATMRGNVIAGNAAYRGGGVDVEYDGQLTLTDCLVSVNAALGNGSGVYVDQATAAISYCTVTGNESPAGRPSIDISGTLPVTLVNSIVAFNSSGIRAPRGIVEAMRSNDVYGNGGADYIDGVDPTGTNGNIRVDPGLSNVYHDVHLQPGSPCIDAGDDSAASPGGTDLYGKPRRIGAHVDIGADESDGTVWNVPPRVWRVSPAGDDAADGATWATAKKTIAAAIAEARPSDEVWAARGSYAEAVRLPAAVALYGGFAGVEAIREERNWAANPTTLQGGVSCGFASVAVDGFTIRDAGIDVSQGIATIANNRIVSVPSPGLNVSEYGVAVVRNNIVTGNRVGVSANGLASLSNNTITGNVTGINGIWSGVTMTNNLVAFNRFGVCGSSASPPALSHNAVYGNTAGNYLGIADATGRNGNISADPLVSNAYRDIHLQPASPCVDAGDDAATLPGASDAYGKPRLIGAHVDIGADESDGTAWTVPARIWHVSPAGDDAADGATWATAKRTLNAALGAAYGGDEVWAANGTYYEAIAPSAGVALYGGFAGGEAARDERDWKANPTILAHYRWVITCNFDATTVSGFTIRAEGNYGVVVYGVADLDNISVSGGRNGGLGITGIADVRDCEFGANGGYGVYVPSGNLVLATSTVSGSQYGIRASGDTVTTLVGNTIRGNSIGCDLDGTATLRDNLIAGNAGDGVQIRHTGALTNNTIVDNGNVGVYVSTDIYVRGTAAFTNNVIAFNRTGVLYSGGNVSAYSHNDVFGNAASNYSVPGNPTGVNGNISADPRFVNRAGGIYRLMPGSPCIDAGDDAVLTAGETDMDGHPRKAGAHVDMGAYEAGSGRFTLADAAKALAIAGGLSAATPEDTARLGLAPGGSVRAAEAVALARMAAGLDVNP